MKIELAGFNVDKNVLDYAKGQMNEWSEAVTPETLSAAYARISRDPAPVSELRARAIDDVEKARKSNTSIVFDMGHSSVAEHAVFNFDAVGISRLAIEAVEHSRLCSYTEKSQRYQRLEDDYVIPPEIETDLELLHLYKALVKAQNDAYHKMLPVLKDQFKSQGCTRKGAAEEDARYVCSLGTEGQLGMTINARNLEHMIRRLSGSPLVEVRSLACQLHQQASAIAPSLLRYTSPTKVATQGFEDLKPLVPSISNNQELIRSTLLNTEPHPDPDSIVLASLLYQVSNLEMDKCYWHVKQLPQEDRLSLANAVLKHLEVHDAVPRQWELVSFTFELTVSASCFAQLKRHRMATIITQAYNPNLGYTVPQSILENLRLSTLFYEVIERTNETYAKLSQEVGPDVATYALTNAHRRRVLVSMNARELYAFCRLRLDRHAQWDIRGVAQIVAALVKTQAPITFLALCGKDAFVKGYPFNPAVTP